MSCYLSRQGTRRSTAEWLTPNHCQEGWDFKLAGWMDEMACPHAAPLAEIYGHPLWSVVSSWFSFSCKNPDGKQKWKLHGLILTWSLVFCDMLQAVHLSAVHPGHSLTHGGKLHGLNANTSETLWDVSLGCVLFLTPRPDEVQGHSEWSVWHQPLRTTAQ